MQCFLTLFCYTRRPSQLRNTVLTPRGDNSYASKQFASRGAVDWKTVRTSWKFYPHPCKIGQFVFPIIPVIQSPQFRSLDRKQNGKIPSICDVWRTPKVPNEWFTCIQLEISSLRPRPHESGYFWNHKRFGLHELKQQRRRRLRKRHLKSEFALLQTLPRLLQLVQFVNCWQIFLELNSKRLYQIPGKENQSHFLVFTS